jgi:prolyl-tRNA synthetase
MKQSHLFTKTHKNISQQDVSINAQLLERAGYISKLMAGVYTFLPLGLRVLTKIETIVREEMDALGSQELLMPALQPRENWEISGRWDTVDILYKLKGAGDRDLLLGPTHEEVVTPLGKEYIHSYKDLPQAVYQIQTKFRNEARPKSGLLRGREFRMKDLYSFHATETDLDAFYDKTIERYFKVFKRCGLADITYLTYASGGIFSKYSHEFQTVTKYGEDTIYLCEHCKVAINKEIIEDLKQLCPQCNKKELVEHKAIEVGNIFKIMTRFSKPFDLVYTTEHDEKKLVVMGCYGMGTSRLMGTVVEVLHDERGIIWPEEIAPFKIHLISLLKADIDKADDLYNSLQKRGLEVLYDDRQDVSPGQKLMDADLLGMPWRMIISPKTVAHHSVEIKARGEREAKLIDFQAIPEFFGLDR